MASTTTNMGLTKPASGEAYSIDVFNGNFDKIDERHMAAAISAGATNLSGETLYNCTGTIASHIRYHVSGKIMMLEGRLTINNYKRTGANPGIQFTLPNGAKAKKMVSITCGINGLYTSNTEGSIRAGENTQFGISAGGSTATINTTESYDNMGSGSTTYNKAVFQIFPIFIELQ